MLRGVIVATSGRPLRVGELAGCYTGHLIDQATRLAKRATGFEAYAFPANATHMIDPTGPDGTVADDTPHEMALASPAAVGAGGGGGGGGATSMTPIPGSGAATPVSPYHGHRAAGAAGAPPRSPGASVSPRGVGLDTPPPPRQLQPHAAAGATREAGVVVSAAAAGRTRRIW